MIKAEEVRRGNLVEYDGRVFEIDVIAEEFPTLNTTEFGIGVVDWNNIRPIPLSEEWLVKMGFVRHPWGLVKSGLLFKDDLNHPCEELTLEVGNGFRVTVNSVHQLQNLTHSLTGEELKIKN